VRSIGYWAAIGAWLLWFGGGAAAAETCDKLVFHRYCLGGEVNQILRTYPDFIQQQRDGERLAVIYAEDRDTIYVLSYQGRVYKVVRKYEPATSLRYDELLEQLTAKYGSPADLSRFPTYVRSPASRLGAIRRGDGASIHGWEFTAQGFAITLSWTREMGLSLAYVDEKLLGIQKHLEQDGL
jgi:hypothetical protein